MRKQEKGYWALFLDDKLCTWEYFWSKHSLTKATTERLNESWKKLYKQGYRAIKVTISYEVKK
jgi:hypothetical protein